MDDGVAPLASSVFAVSVASMANLTLREQRERWKVVEEFVQPPSHSRALVKEHSQGASATSFAFDVVSGGEGNIIVGNSFISQTARRLLLAADTALVKSNIHSAANQRANYALAVHLIFESCMQSAAGCTMARGLHDACSRVSAKGKL